MREAQVAMLAAFDCTDTVTATQLQVATASFSEKTVSRGRAELTREGVLIRGRRGMEGEVNYTIRIGMAQPASNIPSVHRGHLTIRNALADVRSRTPGRAAREADRD